MRVQCIAIVLSLCLFATVVPAQEVEFNYEGRVSVDGLPYTGQGYFKFAIVNWDGSITYWSNDGTSTAGSEPTAAVVTDVTDGVFNVIIGDASNMNPLEASIFNGYEQVFLRVWLSDGILGFEHLAPDRRITNPALLGSQSFREIHLYVNPDTGDDQYPGTSPAHPKRTIQAAWDALPPMIRADATIHLADGTYRESILLTGKTVVGGATIAIAGNAGSPSSVRVTGADAGAETTPVRGKGFHAISQQGVTLEGIFLNQYDSAALQISDQSNVNIRDCVLDQIWWGILVENSTAICTNVSISNALSGGPTYTRGIITRSYAFMDIIDCSVSNFDYGVELVNTVVETMRGCTITGCDKGVNVSVLSNIGFREPSNLIQGNTVGINAQRNCVALEMGNGINWGTGNGTNVTSGTGASLNF